MKKIISVSILFLMTIMVAAQANVNAPNKPIVYDTAHKHNADTNQVLHFAEVMPEFPGGQPAFMKYIGDSIKYPAAEHEMGKQGTVYISFTVEKNGSITEVRAVKEVEGAPGFTKEAIRVFSQMPNWIPGTMQGKPVRITITQPVRFVLQNDPPKQKAKKGKRR